ncbi:MAG: alpha/beta hydrolase [Deltaproteobacteria bacterium]
MARTVSFGRFQFSVDVAGEAGPPVIALHSGGMSARQWKKLLERLAPTHRALAPYFLGYGESSPWPRHEPFHFAHDVLGVEALMDELAEPVHLVAHSYGGLVALHAALHRPRAVRSISLCEPVAFGVLLTEGSLPPLDSMPFGTPVLPEGPGAAETWLTWFVDYWNGEGGWSRIPDRMLAAFLASAPVAYGEVYSLLGERTPANVWATIDAPMLLLHGEHSPPEARRVAAILAQTARDGALHVVRGAGHMAPLTHEADVNDRIVAHIARY